MRQNRKRAPLQVGTVSKSVLTCFCFAVLGLTYVWQKNQVYRLGDDVKTREQALLAAQKRNTMLAAQVAQLASPAYLESRCQQLGLGLVSPREVQVVRLVEPGPEWDAAVLAVIPSAVPAQPVRTARARASQPRPMVHR